MAYDILLLDADGTLLDFEDAEHRAFVNTATLYHIPNIPAALKEYKQINASLWRAHEQGLITREGLQNQRFTRMLRYLNLPGDGVLMNETYMGFLGLGAKCLPGALQVCQTLSRMAKLYIITNGISKTQHQRIQNSGLLPFLSGVIISQDTGFQKPQEGFFAYTMQKLPHQDKSRMLVVGDSLTSDIEGGNRFGIDTCWFNPQHAPNPAKVACTYEIHDLQELIPLVNG